MLTQEEAAARLQAEMGEIQQKLSIEHNLVMEAQVTLTTTQVSWLPTLRSHVCLTFTSVACIASVFLSASTLT